MKRSRMKGKTFLSLSGEVISTWLRMFIYLLEVKKPGSNFYREGGSSIMKAGRALMLPGCSAVGHLMNLFT